MSETTQLSVTNNQEKLFSLLLWLYPKQYRQKYGLEMFLLFQDLYQDELQKKGQLGVIFWLRQLNDMAKGAIFQQLDLLKKQGLKKYLQSTLHLNKYNILGAILLLPILVVFSIDLIARILQRDLVHYNRPVYAVLSHSPLYWFPVLFTWVILFPTLAMLVNLIPIMLKTNSKSTPFLSWAFMLKNCLSLLILALALFFLAVIKLHDFAPCFIHGLTKVGIGQLPQILTVCKQA